MPGIVGFSIQGNFELPLPLDSPNPMLPHAQTGTGEVPGLTEGRCVPPSSHRAVSVSETGLGDVFTLENRVGFSRFLILSSGLSRVLSSCPHTGLTHFWLKCT